MIDNYAQKQMNMYLSTKNYYKYNEVVTNEIINKIVKKIEKKDAFFKYATFVELTEYAEKKLKPKYSNILNRLYDLNCDDMSEKNIAKEITELYKNLIW